MPIKPRDVRVLPVRTEDGLTLRLTNLRGAERPTRGPVLLVHGAGVRSNIFNAPVQETILDALLAEGHDVWLADWRASIDLALTDWSLDQAAAFDHPALVRAVLADTGAKTLKAIIHCQGSTSFAMAAVAGLLPQVDTIVSNAVSLHPVVPNWSRVKLRLAVPLLARLMRSMNPGWGDDTPWVMPRLLGLLTKSTHRECDNTACRLVSFTYGAGCPALWQHENLNEETHEDFIAAEFGHVPLSFFRQMRQCVAAGNLVAEETYGRLPQDFTGAPPKTDARWTFLAGARNKCFLPESQKRSYDWFEGHTPGRHTLHVFEDYSHLDIFMGYRASKDVFPTILQALR